MSDNTDFGALEAQTTTNDEPTETTLADHGAEIDDNDSETRLDSPTKEKFVDGRPDDTEPDAGDQAQLLEDTADGQQTLAGESAAGASRFVDNRNDDDDETRLLGEVYGPTMRQPIPDEERADVIHAETLDYRELAGTAAAPSDFHDFGIEVETGRKLCEFDNDVEMRGYREAVAEFEKSDEYELQPDAEPADQDDTNRTAVEEANACSHGETRELIETDQYGNEATKHICEECSFTVEKHSGTDHHWCDHCDTGDGEEADEIDRGEGIKTDGGRTPANETVRLITGITGVMHSPEVIEGETSSTGKTIAVQHPHKETTYRLDTAEILAGGSEYRSSTYFELYTPKRLQRRQSSNHAPGPQAGSNGVSDAADLPEPTHCPPDESAYPDQGDDESEADAENGEDGAGDGVESPDTWDLSRYNRGGVLLLDSYAGLHLIVKVKRDVCGNVQALNVVNEDGDVYQLKKIDLGGYSFDVRKGRIDGGRFREEGGTAVLRNVDDLDQVQDFERVGQDMDWLREWIRDGYGSGSGDSDDDSGGGGSGDTPNDAGDTPRIMTDGGRPQAAVRQESAEAPAAPADTVDTDDEIQQVGESLLEFVEGADAADLEALAETFERLAEAYDRAPEEAAANPPECQLSEHVAHLWDDVEVPPGEFVRLLDDGATHCWMLLNEQDGGQ